MGNWIPGKYYRENWNSENIFGENQLHSNRVQYYIGIRKEIPSIIATSK